MKPATELIHAASDARRRAADDADLRDDDVRLRERRGGARLQRGAVDEVPLLALRQPDGGGGRAEAGRARGRRGGAACSRAARRRRRPRCSAHLQAGDEVVCSAAIYGGTLHLLADLLPKFGITPRFVSLEELRQPRDASVGERPSWSGSSRRSTRRCAASTSRRSPRACRARGVHLGRSTTPSPARSTSSRSRSASIW